MVDGDETRLIEGGCHCGNIRFAFHWPGAGETIPVRACGCDFCTKHGGVWTSHPEGRLDVRIRDAAGVGRYRFGTSTADFHVCTACGVVPLVTSAIDGRDYAVVNVNCFENVDPAELDRASTDFDGESTGDRLARRKRNWIGAITFDDGPR
jgi:hypothetical protein